jgi:hypothetical protein
VCVVVRVCKWLTLAGTLGLFGGCQSVGPIAIDQGRHRYNHIIQETSKEQTFANIIRVHYREPTTFMDVTEVDATTTFSGTATGGLTNIGATAGLRSTSAGTINGEIGNIGGGVTYTESPLVRYQPLLGQALVGQLATPISPDALASLFDSNWAAIPLLDFASALVTLDDDNTDPALSAIGYLGRHRLLELVAEKSDLTKGSDSTASGPLRKSNGGNVTLEVTNKATNTGASDTLAIYFRPRRPDRLSQEMWNRLRSYYAGTQARPAQKTAPMCPGGQCSKPDQNTERANNRIELRTKAVTPDKMISAHLTSGAPLLRTYSALGILKNAMEAPHPIIGVVDRECYDTIRSHKWNNTFEQDPDLAFFTLLPSEERQCGVKVTNDPSLSMWDPLLPEWLEYYSLDISRPEDNRVSEGLTRQRLIQAGFSTKDVPFVYAPPGISNKNYINANDRLATLRRYILIIQSDSLPPDPYVAYFDQGKWHYIARDDQISQKNFQLITLFMTMMAVPGASQQPLTPAITVGGGM